ncbi:MAG: DUF6261 family protein [Bacteroidales bacterium]
MKKKFIKSILLSRLRNKEHVQFHTEVIELVNAEGAEQLKVVSELEQYLIAYNQEMEAFQPIRKSEITEEIDIADKNRDSTFRGLATNVKGFLHHFNPEVCTAAKRLHILLASYGDIARMTLIEETSAISKLIVEFNGKYKLDVQALKIEEWVTELTKNNQLLEQLIRKRNDENSALPNLSMHKSRKEVDEAYYLLIEKIYGYIITLGIANYENFVRKLNSFIHKYNTESSRHHNKASQAQGTNDTNIDFDEE